jgi:hypothetical protein
VPLLSTVAARLPAFIAKKPAEYSANDRYRLAAIFPIRQGIELYDALTARRLPPAAQALIPIGSSWSRIMVTKPDQPADLSPLLCARCMMELELGTGTFYRVTIEAVADPTPPTISAEELTTDLRERIEHLLQQMQDLSAQEAMDQVYRRLTLYLCGPCYREWIENPTG